MGQAIHEDHCHRVHVHNRVHLRLPHVLRVYDRRRAHDHHARLLHVLHACGHRRAQDYRAHFLHVLHGIY